MWPDCVLGVVPQPTYSRLSDTSCWAETAITWPLIVRIRTCAMRNFLTKQWACEPATILIFPVRVRSRISVCIRVILKHWTFTLEGRVLGHYPPGKIQKTNWECTCFYERVRVNVRARKCASITQAPWGGITHQPLNTVCEINGLPL